MAEPVCINLKEKVRGSLKDLDIKHHQNGIYICIEGPQFSTRAESELYRSWGCDVIGMTNMPESKLALEAGICYASVAMVTDYDCWHPNHEDVSVDQIVKTLKDNASKAQELIIELSKNKTIKCDKKTKNLSSNSVITNTSKIKKATKKKLKYILDLK